MFSLIAEKLRGTPRKIRETDWYAKIMGEFYHSGFNLATVEMSELFLTLVDEQDWKYQEVSSEGKPWKTHKTHARSIDIRDYIPELESTYRTEIELGKAWLMPVDDDDEFVSWQFVIMTGTEDEVLDKLQKELTARGPQVPN